MKKAFSLMALLLLAVGLLVSCIFEVKTYSNYKEIKIKEGTIRKTFWYDTDTVNPYSEQLDFSDLRIIGVKKDGTEEDITKLCYIYSPKLTTGSLITERLKGIHEFTVHYNEGLTCNFEIEILDLQDYTILSGQYDAYTTPFKTKLTDDLNIQYPENKIKKIIFSKEAPTVYSSKTDISVKENGKVLCYLCENGTELYIVGEHIVANKNCDGLFRYFKALEFIEGIELFEVFAVTDDCGLNFLFADCPSLRELNLSKWKTSNIKRFSGMFFNCISLTDINLSNWDTSNATSLETMFKYCSSLQNVDLSSFDMSKVTSFYDLFYSSGTAKPNPTSVRINPKEKTFFDKTELKDWIYEDGEYTYNQYILKSTKESLWDGITRSDITSITFAKPEDYSNPTTSGIDITRDETGKIMMYVDGSDIFIVGESICPSTCFDMFKGFSNLTTITDFNLLDTKLITSTECMFEGCKKLASVDLSNLDTSRVDIMASMFYDCTNLSSLDLSNFDTSRVKNMMGMFAECSNLSSLDLSNFDVTNVTGMNYMFSNCNNLTTVYLKSAEDVNTFSSGETGISNTNYFIVKN